MTPKKEDNGKPKYGITTVASLISRKMSATLEITCWRDKLVRADSYFGVNGVSGQWDARLRGGASRLRLVSFHSLRRRKFQFFIEVQSLCFSAQ